MDNDKYRNHVSVLLKSVTFKNDPVKLVDYIKKNKKYFPNVKPEQLQKILDEAKDIKSKKK